MSHPATDDLPEDIEALKRMVREHRAMLDSRQREIESLRLLIAKLKRMQFGRSSEKLAQQIDQLVLELEELEATAPPPPTTEQPSAPIPNSPQPAAPRRTLPDHLPRKRVVHEVSCECPDCGGPMRQIGEDVSEVLDYVPAQFRVIRHIRPKLACRHCDAIAQAPAPARV